MKHLILSILIVISFIEIKAQVKVYQTFDEFEKEFLIPKNNDTTYIVNFWATWCIPCVKELPYFEALSLKHKNEPISITLVSLDSPKNIETHLIPFIKKKGIKNNVVLLADGKTNKWIDRVNPNWSGAIPITIFLHKEKNSFYEKDYHNLKELETDLIKFKTQKK